MRMRSWLPVLQFCRFLEGFWSNSNLSAADVAVLFTGTPCSADMNPATPLTCLRMRTAAAEWPRRPFQSTFAHTSCRTRWACQRRTMLRC